MKSELTHVAGCRQSLDIEFPADLVEGEVADIARDLARRARVPGFRPGKTPVGVVRTRYRDEIVGTLMNRLLPRGFVETIEERKLNVVDGSEHFEESKYTEGQPLRFRVTFETYPDLTISDYTGIPVEEVSAAVEDSEIDAQLKRIQEDSSELVPVNDDRVIQEGDFVEISFQHSEAEGEWGQQPGNAQVEVGGARTLPEFTAALSGKRVGDIASFPVTYAEDYPAKHLAGRTLEYTIKAEGIKEKKIPELNDEFAERLGDFKSLDEFRARLRQDMENHKRERAREERQQKLLQWLEERNTFDVPETLVDRQIQIRMRRLARDLERQGIDPRRLDVDWVRLQEEQRQQSVRDVKGTLILDSIATAEGLTAGDDEVEREVEKISRETDRPVAKIKEALSHDSGLERLRFEIRRNKTLTFLDERANATKGTKETS
ncbi:MAG TPA: trigger factor [Terriglobia bacterium]|nr:trigger factor [Terriglobia bacterium]